MKLSLIFLDKLYIIFIIVNSFIFSYLISFSDVEIKFRSMNHAEAEHNFDCINFKCFPEVPDFFIQDSFGKSYLFDTAKI